MCWCLRKPKKKNTKDDEANPGCSGSLRSVTPPALETTPSRQPRTDFVDPLTLKGKKKSTAEKKSGHEKKSKRKKLRAVSSQRPSDHNPARSSMELTDPIERNKANSQEIVEKNSPPVTGLDEEVFENEAQIVNIYPINVTQLLTMAPEAADNTLNPTDVLDQATVEDVDMEVPNIVFGTSMREVSTAKGTPHIFERSLTAEDPSYSVKEMAHSIKLRGRQSSPAVPGLGSPAPRGPNRHKKSAGKSNISRGSIRQKSLEMTQSNRDFRSRPRSMKPSTEEIFKQSREDLRSTLPSKEGVKKTSRGKTRRHHHATTARSLHHVSSTTPKQSNALLKHGGTSRSPATKKSKGSVEKRH